MTGVPTVEQRTRDRVARALLEDGPLTATALAQRLQLTPAAVRRHLDTLTATGLVEQRELREAGPRGRGRPAKAFAVTRAGRDAFHHAYDDLAAAALRFLSATVGVHAVESFARARVADLEHRYQPLMDATSSEQRPRVLAEALSADGYAASARVAPNARGQQLCQHHCPVAHVAEEFPQLCEAETQAFARLLDTHVQRLATIAHGESVCTTYVPTGTTSTTPRGLHS
ncbi:MAG: helix-turn-helix domain-containing protein [Actinomycetota bacterium]|nr:helix-turn-helix domain-containing protein [Actinomycetota bacterium]